MNVQIITFYEFKRLENLPVIRERLIAAMRDNSVLGTIILADEGFNSTLSGAPPKKIPRGRTSHRASP